MAKTWGTETIAFVRMLLNLDAPVTVEQEGFDAREWQLVRTADLDTLRGILARKGVRVYGGIPLIAFDADELRDVYAYTVMRAWREGRNGKAKQKAMRRIERLKKTQVYL